MFSLPKQFRGFNPVDPTTEVPKLPASPPDVPGILGSGVMESTTVLAGRYARMNATKKELERQLENIAVEMAVMQDQLLEMYAEEAIQNIRTSDGLVSLRKQLWASAEDPGLLAVSDWAWMVKDAVNVMTLSAAVRELPIDDDGAPIFPVGVPADAIKVVTKYAMRVTK